METCSASESEFKSVETCSMCTCVHRVWNPSLNLNTSLTVIISHKAVERVRWSILVRLTYICTKCFKILADDIIKTPMEHSETVSPQVIKEGRFGSERKCSP